MCDMMMIILVDVIQHSYTRRQATRTGVAHVREETSALLFVITQIFKRGTDGKCTTCDEAEGDHYHHSNGNKYCYVSTTCPPPHVFVLRASGPEETSA